MGRAFISSLGSFVSLWSATYPKYNCNCRLEELCFLINFLQVSTFYWQCHQCKFLLITSESSSSSSNIADFHMCAIWWPPFGLSELDGINGSSTRKEWQTLLLPKLLECFWFCCFVFSHLWSHSILIYDHFAQFYSIFPFLFQERTSQLLKFTIAEVSPCTSHSFSVLEL
jgi:hypothetical protein